MGDNSDKRYSKKALAVPDIYDDLVSAMDKLLKPTKCKVCKEMIQASGTVLCIFTTMRFTVVLFFVSHSVFQVLT
jgi:hypothetical protein